MAVNPNCIDTGLTDILKSDLKKWRKTVGTELDTIAVARTDIEGLESEVFQGASPEVIKAAPKEAGLKPLDEEMPDRIIKAPFEGKKVKGLLDMLKKWLLISLSMRLIKSIKIPKM